MSSVDSWAMSAAVYVSLAEMQQQQQQWQQQQQEALQALQYCELQQLELQFQLQLLQQQLEQQQVDAYMSCLSESSWLGQYVQQALPLQMQSPQAEVAAPPTAFPTAPPAAPVALPDVAAAPVSSAKTQASEEPLTTVMLRDLPEGLSREMLLRLLDSQGFAGSYDFVYLPVSFDTMAALTHAFVNMTSVGEAGRLSRHFEGFSSWPLPSAAVCHVVWNDKHQGLSDLVGRYRNTPVMHDSVPDECKPMLIKNGVRAKFPSPTQNIKPPKVLKSKGGSPRKMY